MVALIWHLSLRTNFAVDSNGLCGPKTHQVVHQAKMEVGLEPSACLRAPVSVSERRCPLTAVMQLIADQALGEVLLPAKLHVSR